MRTKTSREQEFLQVTDLGKVKRKRELYMVNLRKKCRSKRFNQRRFCRIEENDNTQLLMSCLKSLGVYDMSTSDRFSEIIEILKRSEDLEIVSKCITVFKLLAKEICEEENYKDSDIRDFLVPIINYDCMKKYEFVLKSDCDLPQKIVALNLLSFVIRSLNNINKADVFEIENTLVSVFISLIPDEETVITEDLAKFTQEILDCLVDICYSTNNALCFHQSHILENLTELVKNLNNWKLRIENSDRSESSHSTHEDEDLVQIQELLYELSVTLATKLPRDNDIEMVNFLKEIDLESAFLGKSPSESCGTHLLELACKLCENDFFTEEILGIVPLSTIVKICEDCNDKSLVKVHETLANILSHENTKYVEEADSVTGGPSLLSIIKQDINTGDELYGSEGLYMLENALCSDKFYLKFLDDYEIIEILISIFKESSSTPDCIVRLVCKIILDIFKKDYYECIKIFQEQGLNDMVLEKLDSNVSHKNILVLEYILKIAHEIINRNDANSIIFTEQRGLELVSRIMDDFPVQDIQDICMSCLECTSDPEGLDKHMDTLYGN
ncbi:unnamed protein product [Moneuplotes crassus]|uniref:Uncharacterized protein n=1 Tax=Euplotes crassus TaxID=5936 RepID=A0AAD1UCX0_EUPCR|nr:unnamed protein product [Moneuplotes crassus]